MNKKETINIKIKKEIKTATNKLLLKNLSFKEWNQEQQRFGTILYLKILTIQEIYDFSCCLIYSKVNCSTIKEKDELINKKEAIKRFMKGISNPDYNEYSPQQATGYLPKAMLLLLLKFQI